MQNFFEKRRPQVKEIFLMKLGEVVLKGANKRQFESRLRQNVRRRM